MREPGGARSTAAGIQHELILGQASYEQHRPVGLQPNPGKLLATVAEMLTDSGATTGTVVRGISAAFRSANHPDMFALVQVTSDGTVRAVQTDYITAKNAMTTRRSGRAVAAVLRRVVPQPIPDTLSDFGAIVDNLFTITPAKRIKAMQQNSDPKIIARRVDREKSALSDILMTVTLSGKTTLRSTNALGTTNVILVEAVQTPVIAAEQDARFSIPEREGNIGQFVNHIAVDRHAPREIVADPTRKTIISGAITPATLTRKLSEYLTPTWQQA